MDGAFASPLLQPLSAPGADKLTFPEIPSKKSSFDDFLEEGISMVVSNNDHFTGPGSKLPRSQRLYLAILLGMMAAFGPLCTDTYLPSLPDLATDLSVSTAVTQLTITSCLLGMALGQIFVGPISDNKGRRWPLFVSLALFTAASVLCTLANSGNAFIILRFAQGLGGAGGIVLSRAIACDLFRGSELTSFMSLLMSIQGIAPILGPIAGGAIAGLGSWRLIFAALTLFGIVLFLMTIRALPETLPAHQKGKGSIMASIRGMGELFREKAFLCYAGVQGFTMAGFFGYVASSPFIIQNIYGLSVTAYSIIFAINAFSIMIAALITGRLSRHIGDATLLQTGDILRCLACMGTLVITIWTPESPLPLLAAIFCMVALQGVTLTASFTLAINAQKVGAGTASGILGVATFIFGACSSPLVGLAGPDSAVPLGLVSAITGVLSLALTVLGNRTSKRQLQTGAISS